MPTREPDTWLALEWLKTELLKITTANDEYWHDVTQVLITSSQAPDRRKTSPLLYVSADEMPTERRGPATDSTPMRVVVESFIKVDTSNADRMPEREAHRMRKDIVTVVKAAIKADGFNQQDNGFIGLQVVGSRLLQLVDGSAYVVVHVDLEFTIVER